MSRPKNNDAILLALKARLLEFDREFSLTFGTTPPVIPSSAVVAFIEDLKGIFFGNSKMVAPFYLEKLREMESEMSFVRPSQFEKLVKDATLRSDEPESVKRMRELSQERKQGIFRCIKCNATLDVERADIIWNKELSGYEHTLDCQVEHSGLVE